MIDRVVGSMFHWYRLAGGASEGARVFERGNETSTLVATPLGFPVYESFGFRPLERFQMWERGPEA